MIKALQVSDLFAFDPETFSNAIVFQDHRKKEYGVTINLKGGESYFLETESPPAATAKLVMIVEEVNKAVSTSLLESASEQILAPARDLGPMGPTGPAPEGVDIEVAKAKLAHDPPLLVIDGDPINLHPDDEAWGWRCNAEVE